LGDKEARTIERRRPEAPLNRRRTGSVR